MLLTQLSRALSRQSKATLLSTVNFPDIFSWRAFSPEANAEFMYFYLLGVFSKCKLLDLRCAILISTSSHYECPIERPEPDVHVVDQLTE